MKVLTVEAHNVLKVSDIDFDLEGHHLYLVGGRNGQGKTSALNAFVMAICGKSGCDFPDVPLKDGQKSGFVKVSLDGGLTVERHFRRSRDGSINETLKVKDEKGAELKQPQTILNKLYAARGFDPLAFAKMDRKKQAESLRKVVGIDFTESDKKIEGLMQNRRDVTRDLNAARSRLEAMPKHDDAPEQEVSVAELSRELEERENYNRETRSLARQADQIADAAQHKENRIDELLREVETLKHELSDAKSDHEKVTEQVNARDTKDTDSIREKIETAEDDNVKFRENSAYLALESDINDADSHAADLTSAIEEERLSQSEALQKAPWPVDGLGLDDEGVTFNGLPFEQASKSMRIMTSVKMGMAINPDLRVLVCQDGNDLDDKSLEELQEILEENDFQMLLEVVTRSEADEERCCVVIEDGNLKPVEESAA